MVDLLLKKGTADLIADRIFRRRETLHSPYLIDTEVISGIRSHYLRAQINAAQGQLALAYFTALRLTRYSSLPLLPRVWELRDVFSAYDACYVALAEFLKVPLLTLDRRLARTKGHQARIELIS